MPAPRLTSSATHLLDRRGFLIALGSAGAAAGLAACGGSSKTVAGTTAASRRTARAARPTTQSFRSRPDLSPPEILVDTHAPHPALDTFVFTDSHGGRGQQGPLIIDRAGRLVWFNPVSDHGSTRQRVMNVRVQRYRGEPVLTWWQGGIVGAHGAGHYEIVDQRYRQITRVQAGNGYLGDLHEFRLTDAGTALLTSYGQAEGEIPNHSGTGTRRGAYWYGVVQEVDVASGKVLLQWRSDDHVPFSASYRTPPPVDPTAPWDYFHVNAIAVDPSDGNLVISGRNTWACYKVHRRTGELIWTLGGRDGDFAIGDGAGFAFQHHVIPRGGGRLTVFDNEGGPPDHASQSRGLVLSVDESARRVTLERQYLHRPPVLSAALGSVQELEGGGAFVGWGDSSYFTEYDPSGHVILDARLSGGVISYRAFQDGWEGQPVHAPRLAAERVAGKRTRLYASWNGATVHRSWRVLGGTIATAMQLLDTAAVDGFETVVTIPGRPAWVAVEALDAAGRTLERSAAVRV